MHEPPSKDLSIDEKLFTLADLTRRWGVLHEIQVLNLKKWPMFMLGVKDSVCAYEHDSRKLYFTVGDPIEGLLKAELQSYEFLEKSCRYLLGEDIQIAIRKQDETVLYGTFKGYELPNT